MSHVTTHRGRSPFITAVGVMNIVYGGAFLVLGLYVLLSGANAVATLFEAKKELSSAGSAAGAPGEQAKQVDAGADMFTKGVGTIIMAAATVLAACSIVQGLPLLLVGLGVCFRKQWARILAFLLALLAAIEGAACLLSVGQSNRFLLGGILLLGYAVLTFAALLGRRASLEFSGRFHEVEDVPTLQPVARPAQLSPLTLGLMVALMGALALAGVMGFLYFHEKMGRTEDPSGTGEQIVMNIGGGKGSDARPQFNFAQHTVDLHEAVEKGQISRVAELCRDNLAVDDRDEKTGETALMKASAGGNLQMVMLLLALGANASDQDSKGQTPLMKAAEQGHGKVAAALINQPDITQDLDVLRLQLISQKLESLAKGSGKVIPEVGKPASVVPFTFHRADKSAADQEGQTASMKAFLEGHFELSWSLSGSPQSFLARDRKGNNVIHGAAAKGDAGSFASKMLQVNAADGSVFILVNGQWPLGNLSDMRNDLGQTPWMVAAAAGHLDVLKFLLGTPSKPEWLELKDAAGKTALDLAAAAGHQDVVHHLTMLAASKASAATALFQAIEMSDYEAMTRLLQTAGVSPLARDEQDRTLLMKAVLKGDDKAVLLLTSYFGKGKSADYLTAADKAGRTVLMIAATEGKTAAAEALIVAAVGAFNGGKLNWFSFVIRKDKSGKTALELAQAKENKETVAAMEKVINAHLNDRSAGFTELYLSKQILTGGTYYVVPLTSAKTALEQASSTGDVACVEGLLKLGADRAAAKGPAPEDRPHSALSMAAMKGHILVVKALLDSFKDVKARKEYLKLTYSFEDPFPAGPRPAEFFAEKNNHKEIVALLRDYAARQ